MTEPDEEWRDLKGQARGVIVRRWAPLVILTLIVTVAIAVVIGIRAENGSNLPVTYLGKEVGRTDACGTAHIVLSVKANEQLALVLDTKSGGDKAPKLRPESPSLTFVAKDQDDFVTLEQKSEVEKPAPARRRAAPRGGPTRI